MSSKNSQSSRKINYALVNSKPINVALVGRSKTGKSKIVRTLTDPSFVLKGWRFSDTSEPVCKSFTVRDVRDNQFYSLNIIDTPGLKEMEKDEVKSSDDEELLSLFLKFLELEISEINVICFVSHAGETHLHDIDVFNRVMRFLGEDFSQISMMVLTHCDSFDSKQLDEFENGIKTHPRTKETFEYCKLGIKRFEAVSTQKLDALLEGAQDDEKANENLKRAEANLMATTEVMCNDLIEAWIQTNGSAKQILEIKDISQTLAEHLFQHAFGRRDTEIAAKEEKIKELQGKIRDLDDANIQNQQRYETKNSN